jgi:Immunity protein 7
MFEFHGWATLRFTPENRDVEDEDELQQAVVEAMRAYVQELGWTRNPIVDLRWMNGQAHLRAEGFKNHSAGIEEELVRLFRSIAQVAPGSYGLLYTLNDEDPSHENVFRVYVLARGALIEQSDPFLSPFVPTVEDPYSES